ncbi:MAG: helicase-related protein, partial [Alphaproteobacteria bacterium]
MHVSNKAIRNDGRIIAYLGPTNTGKTYRAIERMLSYQSGVIGFPLRLLARENYERVVAAKGRSRVALLTGEEKIIPPQAKYFCCTVESMPVEKDFEFLAIDEVQLAEDSDRGHVFTDRILRARGLEETVFLGSDTMKPVLSRLVPGITFEQCTRFSLLSYTGFKKLTRLPKRTAIVGFSMDDVYNMAELIRRQRGGTAVVLGALSPRTRNKQVEMYQSGEVDFMVATDAIGMGLNMDINHVALAATRKFDGHRVRPLRNMELAQIAGRAGRYMRDGTFGVTGRVSELEEDTVKAIENHQFDSVREIYWRNSNLDFSSPKMLSVSLDTSSGDKMLVRGRPSDDYLALKAMMERDDVMARATNPEQVRLLWDVCQIPDFRQTLNEAHQDLIANIYIRVSDNVLGEDWVAAQIKRLDDSKGDVDALMTRIAHVRT